MLPWRYVLLALLMMLSVTQAHGEIRVCQGECSYSSIQAAIDATAPGNAIVIESGIYKEDLNINKSITLRGLDTGYGRPVMASCDSIAVNTNGFGLRGIEIADEHSLNITGSGNIYLNNFPASGGMLVDGACSWNSTEPITFQFESKIFRGPMGNYWADYTGKDENHDGIGDEPKVIDSRNIDYYPLMQPVESYGIADEREDRMETIKARTGEPFNITLESNPTTGYRWYADYDYGLMNLDESRYERDASGAIGAGGREIFTFTPIRSGEARISMVYRRPWENIAADVRSFQVIIS
jgi:predicted secreted protein